MAEFNLGTAKGRIELDASGFKRGAAEARAENDSLRSNLEQNRAKVAAVGTALVGVGAAAAAGFAKAVSAAADFESALSNFQSATRVTAEELDEIRQKAIQLGQDTSFGAAEAANAMVELGKAGQDVTEILSGTADATIALAEAGETDLVFAAETMVQTLSQFRLGAEEAERVSNALIGAADASTASVESLAEGMKYAGPQAAAMGITVEEAAAQLALFSQAGLGGSMAGTTMRSMLTNLNPITDRAKEAMQELGLYTEEAGSQFFDAQGDFIGLERTAGLLTEAMGDLSAEQRNAAVEAIFGQRAISGVNAIVTEGAEGFQSFYEGVSGGDAAETAAIKLDNLKGSITILKGTIETFLISAGSPFQSMLKGVVDTITLVINKFSALSPQLRKAIVIGVLVAAGLATIAGAGLLVAAAATAMSGAFALFTGTILPIIGITLGVVAAIAALAYGAVKLYQNWEPFRDLVQSIIGWFKNLFNLIGGLVNVFRDSEDQGNNFAETMDAIFGNSGRLARMFKALYDFVSAIIDGVRTVLEAAGRNIAAFWQAHGEKILAFLRAAWQTIATVVTTVITFIANVIATNLEMMLAFWQAHGDKIVNAIKTAFNFIVTAIRVAIAVIVGIFNFLRAVLDGVVAFIKGFVSVVVGFWQIFGDNIMTYIKDAFDFVRKTIKNVIDVVTGIVQAFIALFTGDWRGLGEAIKKIWNALWRIVGDTIQFVLEMIANLIATVIETVVTLWRRFGDNLIAGAKAAWQGVKNWWTTMMDYVKALPGRILEFFKALPGRMLAKGKEIIQGLVDGTVDRAERMYDRIQRMIERIKDFFTNLPGDMLRIGEQLIQGLIDGITNMAGAVRDKAMDIVRNVKDSFLGAFDFGSPSKVMKQYGEWAIQGLAQGMEAMKRPVVRVATDVADATLSAVAPAAAAAPTGALAPATTVHSAPAPSQGSARDGLAALLRGNGPLVKQDIHNASNADVTRATERALRKVATEWDL